MAAPHDFLPSNASARRSTSRTVRHTRSRDRSSSACHRRIAIFRTSGTSQPRHRCWLGRTKHHDDHWSGGRVPRCFPLHSYIILTLVLRSLPLETHASSAGKIMRVTAAYFSSLPISLDVSLAVRSMHTTRPGHSSLLSE